MSERKETPDILGDILGGEAPAQPAPAEIAPPAAPKATRAKRTTTRKRSQSSRSKSRKAEAWEYQLVSCQDYKGWRPRYIDGREIPDWMESPPLSEYLTQMGDQGWELISACSGEKMFGLGDKYQLYFKRKK
jgi:hypothetical protein